ncbi:MAG: hypothetical protein MJE68_29925, partial [Proteobacteria bacterium]|nr:hypothetical protein [Pseudomonadota bacterium]
MPNSGDTSYGLTHHWRKLRQLVRRNIFAGRTATLALALVAGGTHISTSPHGISFHPLGKAHAQSQIIVQVASADPVSGASEAEGTQDLPAVFLNSIPNVEEGGNAKIQIGLNNKGISNVPHDLPVTVEYETLDGTAGEDFRGNPFGGAISGGDFPYTRNTVTIPVGINQYNLTIPVYADGETEGNERFVVRIFNPTNAVLSIRNESVTIIDGPPAPTISVVSRQPSQTNVTKGEAANFTIYIANPAPYNISVGYRLGGTAFDGIGSPDTSAIILAGDTNANISIDTSGGEIREGWLQLTLRNPINAVLGTTATAEVTIEEVRGAIQNIPPTVHVYLSRSADGFDSLSSLDILESNTTGIDDTFYVFIQGTDGVTLSGNVTVQWNIRQPNGRIIQSVTSTANTHNPFLLNGNLDITASFFARHIPNIQNGFFKGTTKLTPGNAATGIGFAINGTEAITTGDADSRQLIFELLADDSYIIADNAGSAILTVVDEDPAISLHPATADTPYDFTVGATPPPTTPNTIHFQYRNATTNQLLTNITPTSVTLAAGQEAEDIALDNPEALLGESIIAEIVKNTAAGTDLTATPYSITTNPAQQTARLEFPLPPVPPTIGIYLAEEHTLDNTNINLLSQIYREEVFDNSTAVHIRTSNDIPLPEDVTVAWRISGDTETISQFDVLPATTGAELNAQGTEFTIAGWQPGQTISRNSPLANSTAASVKLIGDGVNEGAVINPHIGNAFNTADDKGVREVTFTLVAGEGYEIDETHNTVSLFIYDDDPIYGIRLTDSNAQSLPANSPLGFTVFINGAVLSGGNDEVLIRYTDGDGADLTPQPSPTHVVVPSGRASVNFEVTPPTDYAGVIRAELRNSNPANLTQRLSYRLTDDTTQQTAEVTLNEASNELLGNFIVQQVNPIGTAPSFEDSNLAYRVQLPSGAQVPQTTDIPINLVASGDFAYQNISYIVPSQQVETGQGIRGGGGGNTNYTFIMRLEGGDDTGFIFIDGVDDDTDEVSGELKVQIFNTTSNGTPNPAQVLFELTTAINDNDPMIGIMANAENVTEGQPANFTIFADATPTQPHTIYIDYRDENGAGLPQFGPTEVVLPANQRNLTFPVTYPAGLTGNISLVNATIIASPPQPRMYLVSSDASFASFLFSQAQAQDFVKPVLTVSASVASVDEGDEVVFAINFNQTSTQAVDVLYQIDGTATQGTDHNFPRLNGRVVIPAGISQHNITIATVADNLTEGDETLTMSLILLGADNAIFGDPKVVSVTIKDTSQRPQDATGGVVGPTQHETGSPEWEVVRIGEGEISDVTSSVSFMVSHRTGSAALAGEDLAITVANTGNLNFATIRIKDILPNGAIGFDSAGAAERSGPAAGATVTDTINVRSRRVGFGPSAETFRPESFVVEVVADSNNGDIANGGSTLNITIGNDKDVSAAGTTSDSVVIGTTSTTPPPATLTVTRVGDAEQMVTEGGTIAFRIATADGTPATFPSGSDTLGIKIINDGNLIFGPTTAPSPDFPGRLVISESDPVGAAFFADSNPLAPWRNSESDTRVTINDGIKSFVIQLSPHSDNLASGGTSNITLVLTSGGNDNDTITLSAPPPPPPPIGPTQVNTGDPDWIVTRINNAEVGATESSISFMVAHSSGSAASFGEFLPISVENTGNLKFPTMRIKDILPGGGVAFDSNGGRERSGPEVNDDFIDALNVVRGSFPNRHQVQSFVVEFVADPNNLNVENGRSNITFAIENDFSSSVGTSRDSIIIVAGDTGPQIAIRNADSTTPLAGQGVNLTVYAPTPADLPATDLVVDLVYTDGDSLLEANPPASVTITAGNTNANFTVPTTPFTAGGDFSVAITSQATRDPNPYTASSTDGSIDISVAGNAIVPVVSVANITIDEGTAKGFTVTLSEATTVPVTVVGKIRPGTAESRREDYFVPGGTDVNLVFNPGETEKTTTNQVTTIADDRFGDDRETVHFNIFTVENATVADDGVTPIIRTGEPTNVLYQATAFIIDTTQPPSDPVVTVSVNRDNITEGQVSNSVTAVATIALDKPHPTPVTVEYTLAGNATFWDGVAANQGGTDYRVFTVPAPGQAAANIATPSGTLIIPANTTSTRIRFVPLRDTVDEAPESILFTISNPTSDSGSITLGDPASISLSVIDPAYTPPPALPTLSLAAPATIDEDETFNFTVTLSEVSSDPVTVEYTLTGNATLGSFLPNPSGDYIPPPLTTATGTLTIDAGDLNATLPIVVRGDNTTEGEETITLTLTNPSGATLATPDTASVTIADTSLTTTPPVTPTNNPEFIVTRVGDAVLPVANSVAFTITTADGQPTSTRKSLPYSIFNDGTLVSGRMRVSVAGGDIFTGPFVDLGGNTPFVSGPRPGQNLSLTFDIDPDITSFTVTIPLTPDPDESSNFTFTAGNATDFSSDSIFVGTIDGGEKPPIMSIRNQDRSDPAALNTITTTDGTNVDLTVYAFDPPEVVTEDTPIVIAYGDGVGGDALNLVHRNEAGNASHAPTTVTILAGDRNANFTVPLRRGTVGGDLTVSIVPQLNRPTAPYAIDTRIDHTQPSVVDGSVTGTVVSPTVTIDRLEVTEGTQGNITIRLSEPTTLPVRVHGNITAVTATSGRDNGTNDYNTSPGRFIDVIFPPGTTTNTSFAINAHIDDFIEDPETVRITLDRIEGPATFPGDADTYEATASIIDATVLPTVSFTGPASINEGETATYTVTYSRPHVRDVGVNYTTGSLTTATPQDNATAGEDYVATSGRVLIPAGQTTGTFTVQTLADLKNDEGDETFSVRLTRFGAAGRLEVNQTARDIGIVTTIKDIPQTPPTLSLAVSRNNITETSSLADPTRRATYTLTLNETFNDAISVAYAFSGTAQSPSDYRVLNSEGVAIGVGGKFTIPPLQDRLTFSVESVNDSNNEANETVVLTLNNPMNAMFGADPATAPETLTHSLTITDDDEALPTLTLIAPETIDEGQAGNVTLRLDRANSRDTRVTVFISGNATSGVPPSGDYFAQGFTPGSVSSIITIPSGTLTHNITIGTFTDDNEEGNETIRVRLVNAVGGVSLGTPSDVNITLVDLTPPTVPSNFIVRRIGPAQVAGDTSPIVFEVANAGGLPSGVEADLRLVMRNTGNLRFENVQLGTINPADSTVTLASTFAHAEGGFNAPPPGLSATYRVSVAAGVSSFTLVVRGHAGNGDISEGQSNLTLINGAGDEAPRDSVVLRNPNLGPVFAIRSHVTGRTPDTSTNFNANAGTTVPLAVYLSDPAAPRNTEYNIDLRYTPENLVTDAAPRTVTKEAGSRRVLFDVPLHATNGGELRIEIVPRVPADPDATTPDPAAYRASTSTANIGTGGHVRITVAGTTPPPVATLPLITLADPDPVTEGEPVTFTLTLNDTSTTPITVDYELSGNATLSTSGPGTPPNGDYVAPPPILTASTGTLTIPANSASLPVTFFTVQDSDVEGDEGITLTLSNPTGADLDTISNAPLSASVTINDNTTAPPVALPRISLPDPDPVTEGEPVTFTITLSDTSSTPITVDYALSGNATLSTSLPGTPPNGDYVAPPPILTSTTGTLTINPNTASLPISFFTVADSDIEGDEGITLTLSNPTGAELDSIGNAPLIASVTINDNTTAPPVALPQVSVTASPASVNEGEEANFTIRLDKPASAAVAVTYRVTDNATGGVGED